MTADDLTPASLALFRELAGWAGDWSGTPLVDLTASQRGNLTDLKRNGLLTTFDDDGCLFAMFTQAGVDLAASIDIDLSWIDWLAHTQPTRGGVAP